VLTEFIHNAVANLKGIAVFAGIGERSREGLELWQELRARGFMDRTAMIFGQMKEPPGARVSGRTRRPVRSGAFSRCREKGRSISRR
jgi:F0F1-type ATP synthase beta subunit